MTPDGPFDLARFVSAQAPVFDRVMSELRDGAKRTHWMWFVFPQIAGLGSSLTAQRYAIASLQEAQAFLAHPLLGHRLREATRAVLATEGLSLGIIFGAPDDIKFRSSMTLFERASGGEELFREALERFCDGMPDDATLRRLS